MIRKSTQPKVDPALYADFLAAITSALGGVTATAHGCTISAPSKYALRIESRRTVRDPWTGELSYAVGLSGGDAQRPKFMATQLAFQVSADRALRAEMLAAAKSGILSGAVTHEPTATAI